jgi:hypothetical protein
MTDIQARVRAQLRARLKAAGATEFSDDQLFADVDAIFRQALSNDDPGALVLPALLSDDAQPELSLRLASHRGGLGAAIVFVKRRILLPLTRFLFEYTLENFRRQHRTNLALMACLQTLAIENARLRRDLDARLGPRGADAAGAGATEADTGREAGAAAAADALSTSRHSRT